MNLLITGAFALKDCERKKLEEMGHEIVFMPQEKDTLPCRAKWVEGIIGNGIFLSHPIENFTSLKFIQLTSAGLDRVPMDYISKKGIKIFNAKGVYSVPMAEFALCGVLNLYKQSRFFYDNQKEKSWQKNRNLLELFEKKVAILGCGSVGSEVAKRFKAFGCEITGFDLVPYQNESFEKMLSLEKMDDMLCDFDILVLTLPLTDETRGMIDEKRLAKMKKGAVIVNISRGGVVDEKALTKALKTNLGGAVLDVFEKEPPENENPLWEMENVIISPHNSFVGEKNHERMFFLILKNLA